MSCDHKLVETYLFDYLNGTVEPTTARAIEQVFDQCDECRDLYQSAIATRQMEQRWQNQSVPEWNRAKFAVSKPISNRLNWFGALSFTFSILAISMVMFRVEFLAIDGGFKVSFGNSGAQAQVEKLVNERINKLAAQQARYIDTRFEEQRLQVASDNQEMITTLLRHNREERAQDLSILMASWLQQRDMDKAELNQRVDYVVDNQIANNRSLNHLIKVSN